MPRSTKPAAVLAIILVSYFMILLDNSVIFTGLPAIRAGLDLSPTQLSWVQDAYVLVFGGLLLLAARAGDILGRRRLFIAGLAVFGTASLLIGGVAQRGVDARCPGRAGRGCRDCGPDVAGPADRLLRR